MPSPNPGPDEVTFGPLRLNRQTQCVTRGGTPIEVGGRAFRLLDVLVSAGGDLVGKNELLDRIWSGAAVEENNLQVQVSALRRALGDGWIVNVPGRGYRLAAPTDAAVGTLPPIPSGRPTLAVLPFANLSRDPDQEYFADALTEEITIALSRVRWFLVVARRSAFAYKNQEGTDVREIGRALGARYVLEGSVRRTESRIRITGSLITAETGLRLWSDRYEGSLGDVFALQDRFSEAVAGAIEPILRGAEISRARARPTEHLDAYDLYLRSLPMIWAGTRDSYAEAIRSLRSAIDLDPSFIRAKASLSFALMNNAGLGWGDAAGRADGARLAAEALAAERDDPEVLKNAGHALAFLAGEHDQALAALNRALALSPNSMSAICSAGWVRCYRIEAQPAIELFERALRLSPLDPEVGYVLSGLGLAHLIAGNDGVAVDILRRAAEEMPTWFPALQFLVVALHRLGDSEKAKQAADRLMAAMPRLRARPSKWAFRPGAFCGEFMQALQAAGVPP